MTHQLLHVNERLQYFTAEKKTAVINWSGQRLEDKLNKDGFPSFSGENRSTARNVRELLTWLKWKLLFQQKTCTLCQNSPCRCLI